MTIEAVNEAESEAKRFLKRVKEFRQRIKDDDYMKTYWSMTGCAESGALKRSSMDLSRALVKLR